MDLLLEGLLDQAGEQAVDVAAVALLLEDVYHSLQLAVADHLVIPEEHLFSSDSGLYSVLNCHDLPPLVLRQLQRNKALPIGVVAVEQECSLLEFFIDAAHDETLLKCFKNTSLQAQVGGETYDLANVLHSL